MLEKSVAAIVAAIEIYNKPDFRYREEVFSILAVNAWELLAKAYLLKLNKNSLKCLYVYDKSKKKSGQDSKRLKVKLNRSGNPITHSLEHCLALIEQKTGSPLNPSLKKNIEAIIELRDNSVHFLNRIPTFSKKLQEIGSATLKNYVTLVKTWFNYDMSEFNFYLMPLSFFTDHTNFEAVILNREEKRFLKFIDSLEKNDTDVESPFNITVNINVSFSKTRVPGAIEVTPVRPGDPLAEGATRIVLTEEQIQERYPWTYRDLVDRLQQRYADFRQDRKFHQIRKSLVTDERFVLIRYLDPKKPKSARKYFYNANIVKEFDKYYTLKSDTSFERNHS